jgi:Flp pilus assembly protein TadG
MNRLPRIRLRHDGRAATAVEFALVCVPFTIFLLAIMGVGLQYYLQQALDFAVQSAARQVQLGFVPATSTQADFVTNVFCPIFGQFQLCSSTSVFVDIRPVTDFQQLSVAGAPDAPNSTTTTSFKFCPGQPGQLMYVHVVFLAPSIAGALLTYGSPGNAIVANAAFANENPTGTAVAAPAC